MAEETKPETKTYRGNCHCGAFVYELTCPEIKAGCHCNCSICAKKGQILTMIPEGSFKVVKGSAADDLTGYHPEGGKGNIYHKFCKNCGTPVYACKGAEGPAAVVNVRTIQDLDVWALEETTYDGWKLEPQYKVPEHKGEEPTHKVEGDKLYTGSCHCGAVTIAVVTKPLDSTYDGRVAECDCSICIRNGYIWFGPDADQTVISGADNLSTYSFAKNMAEKTFCKTCGVHISNDFIPKTPEEIAALPERAQAFYEANKHKRFVNLNVLNNYSPKDSGLKIAKSSFAKTLDPQYVNP